MNIRAVVKEDKNGYHVEIEGFETARDTYKFSNSTPKEVCETIARHINTALSEYDDV
jgi:hypothetical protein